MSNIGFCVCFNISGSPVSISLILEITNGEYLNHVRMAEYLNQVRMAEYLNQVRMAEYLNQLFNQLGFNWIVERTLQG